jgi:hypothetical protein
MFRTNIAVRTEVSQPVRPARRSSFDARETTKAAPQPEGVATKIANSRGPLSLGERYAGGAADDVPGVRVGVLAAFVFQADGCRLTSSAGYVPARRRALEFADLRVSVVTFAVRRLSWE